MPPEKPLKENNPRILALLILAEQNSTLSLAELSKELGITDPEELEQFLIDAIQSGVIKGKIDEQCKEFRVTSLEYVNFGRPQWELLRSRITSLIDSLQKSTVQLSQLADEQMKV